MPRPPNDHLSYAITWFGLALALAVIFTVWSAKVSAPVIANDRTAYDRLTARFARIATIGEASSMLGWDAAAMMPPGGGAARGDQLAVLAGLSHGLLTEPATADDLAEAEAAGPDPDPWRAANLAPDAPRPHPRDRAAARSGGGASARQFGLREGVARWLARHRTSPAVAASLDRGGPADARGGRRRWRRRWACRRTTR